MLYLNFSPIFLFAAVTVPSGFETACLLAGSPTKNWPSFVNATTDGNALPYNEAPSALGTITGFPACITDAAQLLVPKSMPIIFSFAILLFLLGFLADFYLCMPKHLFIKHVAFLQFFYYYVFFHVIMFFYQQNFVVICIKLLVQ